MPPRLDCAESGWSVAGGVWVVADDAVAGVRGVQDELAVETTCPVQKSGREYWDGRENNPNLRKSFLISDGAFQVVARLIPVVGLMRPPKKAKASGFV